MTPFSQTLYACSLFMALVSLWLWAKRRRREAQMIRRAVTDLTRQNS